MLHRKSTLWSLLWVHPILTIFLVVQRMIITGGSIQSLSLMAISNPSKFRAIQLKEIPTSHLRLSVNDKIDS
jgi:hypothetical protein